MVLGKTSSFTLIWHCYTWCETVVFVLNRERERKGKGMGKKKRKRARESFVCSDSQHESCVCSDSHQDRVAFVLF